MENPLSVISANDLFADDPSELFVDVGEPDYQRRLTDKILAAFNHAYSVGESDIAEVLKAALSLAEARGKKQHTARRDNQALSQAEAWVDFVAARDHYKDLAEGAAAAPEELDAALNDMKTRYRRWSEG